MNSVWTARRQLLAERGLNAWGVADGQDYAHILTGCQSVVVLGSGGPTLWNTFVADLEDNPHHLYNEDHPLDAFVARILNDVDPQPGTERRWIVCASDAACPVDFRTLALQAGLGWRSLLGLLISPEYGPWLGLRAACFTTERLSPNGSLSGDGPCPRCSAPCVPACPGNAMSKPTGAMQDLGGWNVNRCSQFHQLTEVCSTTCHSREACPEGHKHRYGPLQVRYHYNRKIGRVELAQKLNIADQRMGLGPFWGDWSTDT